MADAAHEINGSVYALTADSAGRLYAAGSFINIDEIPNADHVAMFDGTWHAMQAGAVDDITRSIASDGTNVYIGSDSVDIAGIAQADHVAKWNGSAWSALGANAAEHRRLAARPSTFINAIATSGSNVFVDRLVPERRRPSDGRRGRRVQRLQLGADGLRRRRQRPAGRARATRSPCSAARSSSAATSRPPAATAAPSYIARYPGAAHPLTAVIRLGNGGFSPFVGSTASFDGSASDGDSPIVSYRWSWNDGSPDSTGPRVAHVLTKQGTNVVTLTVTDSAGHTAQASEDFFIAGQYPQARFAWSPTTVFAGQTGRVRRERVQRRRRDDRVLRLAVGRRAPPDASTAKPTHTSSPRPAPTRWPCSCSTTTRSPARPSTT